MIKCEKKCYTSRKTATNVAIHCVVRGEATYLRPYWCDQHQAYHLTKMAKEDPFDERARSSNN